MCPLRLVNERQATAFVKFRSYLNLAYLSIWRANFLCENLKVVKVSGSQLTCSTRHLTSLSLRICRVPSTPDVEGVIVFSSRVQSKFFLCRAAFIIASHLTFYAELYKTFVSSERHFSSLTRTQALAVISISDPFKSYSRSAFILL